MPRKLSLQEETAVNSPLRRSSRISVTANPSTPTTSSSKKKLQFETEAQEAKTPKTRRASITQENSENDERIETRLRGRRASAAKEEIEQKPEPAKPRSRRSSATSDSTTGEEEKKQFITKRRRSSAVEEQPEPEAVKPVRSRRSSAADKPEEETTKKSVKGRRNSMQKEEIEEEPVRKSLRIQKGSVTGKTDETVEIVAKLTRSRRSSTEKLEDEPEIKTTRLTPSKSRRRLSVTENAISLEPITEQESETKSRTSDSPIKSDLKVVLDSCPIEIETPEKDKANLEISTETKITKSTPVKSRRQLPLTEKTDNLEPIKEVESPTRYNDNSPTNRDLRVVLHVPSTKKNYSKENKTNVDLKVIDEPNSSKSVNKISSQKKSLELPEEEDESIDIVDKLEQTIIKLEVGHDPHNAIKQEATESTMVKKIHKSKSEHPNISMDLYPTGHLNVSSESPNSQHENQDQNMEDDLLNSSHSSSGSNKENLETNFSKDLDETKDIENKEKLININTNDNYSEVKVVVRRVSNVFRPTMVENSFEEPMDVDEFPSILETTQNKTPLELDQSNISSISPMKSVPLAKSTVKNQENFIKSEAETEAFCDKGVEVIENDSEDESFKLSLSISHIGQSDETQNECEIDYDNNASNAKSLKDVNIYEKTPSKQDATNSPTLRDDEDLETTEQNRKLGKSDDITKIVYKKPLIKTELIGEGTICRKDELKMEENYVSTPNSTKAPVAELTEELNASPQQEENEEIELNQQDAQILENHSVEIQNREEHNPQIQVDEMFELEVGESTSSRKSTSPLSKNFNVERNQNQHLKGSPQSQRIQDKLEADENLTNKLTEHTEVEDNIKSPPDLQLGLNDYDTRDQVSNDDLPIATNQAAENISPQHSKDVNLEHKANHPNNPQVSGRSEHRTEYLDEELQQTNESDSMTETPQSDTEFADSKNGSLKKEAPSPNTHNLDLKSENSRQKSESPLSKHSIDKENTTTSTSPRKSDSPILNVNDVTDYSEDSSLSLSTQASISPMTGNVSSQSACLPPDDVINLDQSSSNSINLDLDLENRLQEECSESSDVDLGQKDENLLLTPPKSPQPLADVKEAENISLKGSDSPLVQLENDKEIEVTCSSSNDSVALNVMVEREQESSSLLSQDEKLQPEELKTIDGDEYVFVVPSDDEDIEESRKLQLNQEVAESKSYSQLVNDPVGVGHAALKEGKLPQKSESTVLSLENTEKVFEDYSEETGENGQIISSVEIKEKTSHLSYIMEKPTNKLEISEEVFTKEIKTVFADNLDTSLNKKMTEREEIDQEELKEVNCDISEVNNEKYSDMFISVQDNKDLTLPNTSSITNADIEANEGKNYTELDKQITRNILEDSGRAKLTSPTVQVAEYAELESDFKDIILDSKNQERAKKKLKKVKKSLTDKTIEKDDELFTEETSFSKKSIKVADTDFTDSTKKKTKKEQKKNETIQSNASFINITHEKEEDISSVNAEIEQSEIGDVKNVKTKEKSHKKKSKKVKKTLKATTENQINENIVGGINSIQKTKIAGNEMQNETIAGLYARNLTQMEISSDDETEGNRNAEKSHISKSQTANLNLGDNKNKANKIERDSEPKSEKEKTRNRKKRLRNEPDIKDNQTEDSEELMGPRKKSNKLKRKSKLAEKSQVDALKSPTTQPKESRESDEEEGYTERKHRKRKVNKESSLLVRHHKETKMRKQKSENQRQSYSDEMDNPQKHIAALKELENPKLDEYLYRKFAEIQREEEQHCSESYEEQDEDDSKEENEYICSMAEEGEEDTPSENSNDIIDEGESINTTESENTNSDNDYDEDDSFICDDEDIELLSGDEYDLSDEKYKKKSRIIQLDDYEDDIIKVKKEEKPIKKKKSRIITISDSSDNENETLAKHGHEHAEGNINIANLYPEPSINKVESCIEKVDEVTILKESTPNTSITSIKSDISTNTIDTAEKQVKKSRPSITIHDNISVSDIKDAALTERINNLVDTFCTSLKKGELSMNLSLECSFKDGTEDSPSQKEKVINVTKKSMKINVPKTSVSSNDVPCKSRDSDDSECDDVFKDTNNISADVSRSDSCENDTEEDTSSGREQRLSITLDNIEGSEKKLTKKRRLSKSLEDIHKVVNKKKRKAGKAFKKAKKLALEKVKNPRRANKLQQQPSSSARDDLRTQTCNIMNQLITDVRNRPIRTIKPTRDILGLNNSWITEIADVKPSTSIVSRREMSEYKSNKVHPKDFRTQILYKSARVKRVDTKTLLRKRGAYF